MKPPTACRHLCNKAWFLPPPADDGREDPEPLATPFWCGRTQEAVGPDDREVSESACEPGRECFRPEVEL